MSTLYANNFGPGIPLGSGLVPGSPAQGAMNANMLAGGFMTVPTFDDRDAIPIDTAEGLKLDGLTSGRRQVGMVVTIAETGERFELKIAGFSTLSTVDKLVALADNTNWMEFASGAEVSVIDLLDNTSFRDLVVSGGLLRGSFYRIALSEVYLKDNSTVQTYHTWIQALGSDSVSPFGFADGSANGYENIVVRYGNGIGGVTFTETEVGGSGATEAYVDTADATLQSLIATEKQRLDTLVDNAPQALDTLKEIADQLAADEQGAAAILATQQQHTQQLTNVVHKTGDETISGNKIFTQAPDAQSYRLDGTDVLVSTRDQYGTHFTKLTSPVITLAADYRIEMWAGAFVLGEPRTGSTLQMDNYANAVLSGSFTSRSTITATKFIGDGSQLTNLPAAGARIANSAVFMVTTSGAQTIDVGAAATGLISVTLLEAGSTTYTRIIWEGFCAINGTNLNITADAQIQPNDKILIKYTF